MRDFLRDSEELTEIEPEVILVWIEHISDESVLVKRSFVNRLLEEKK